MRRILYVVFPQVWKFGHRDAVDDSVVRRPADRQDVGDNDIVLFVEPWESMNFSYRADNDLRRKNQRFRVCPTDLKEATLE